MNWSATLAALVMSRAAPAVFSSAIPGRSELGDRPGAGVVQPVGLFAVRRDVAAVDGAEEVGQRLSGVDALEEHGQVAQRRQLLRGVGGAAASAAPPRRRRPSASSVSPMRACSEQYDTMLAPSR